MPGHFLFEDEHQAFRKTIRQFLEREVNPHADAWEEAGRMPKEMFLRGGELGFFGHCVPEEYGGHGGDCRWAVVLAEELAHARTSGVGMGFGAHSEIAMPHIVKFGTPAQKAKVSCPTSWPGAKSPRWGSPSRAPAATWPVSKPARSATAPAGG